ncbi:hypothetical protein C9374_001397 [Naegleria lovaniensis]|uniref:Uncharacterized protein n=1 Tax=Naegleria lovaniensis TaxID=51637 RepID=A0AA88KMP7_NAELO|nr:uncharacterized protein C9374_001397 [Naegleria lovaniensis]KAG2387803.1 hypothetical protein C9374_001397 [Naegleria lovaniensis]
MNISTTLKSPLLASTVSEQPSQHGPGACWKEYICSTWFFKLTLFMMLFFLVTRYEQVLGLHHAPPASIIYTGNGMTSVVGFITDVNNDRLLDFVIAYYQRDYNFANNVIYLNNGCEYVRHSNPYEPLVYCKQHFLNQIMIKWEEDPPVVTLHVPNETFSAILGLPYHPVEIPALIFSMSGVKIGTPMEKFFKGHLPIHYHSISKGDEIYVGQPGPPLKPTSTKPSSNAEDASSSRDAYTTLPYTGTGTGMGAYYYGNTEQQPYDVTSSSGQATGGQQQTGVIPVTHGKVGHHH